MKTKKENKKRLQKKASVPSFVIKTLFVFILCFLYQEANAQQWVQTSGPYGGATNALAVDSPFVYSGVYYGGVYKSSDNGFNWARINNGLTGLRIMALTKVGGNLFAGTDIEGMFLSTDNGASWTAINNGLPPPTSSIVYSFASNGTNVYAATGSGIFMTADFGANWTAMNTGLVSQSAKAIIVADTNMFVSNNDGVYISSNWGVNWTSVSVGLNNNSIGALAMSDTTLFASAVGSDSIFISQNNGGSWSPTVVGTNFAWINSLYADSGKIYAATNWDWIYSSSDNGVSWQQLSSGILHKNISQISKIGTSLIASTTGGIYQSNNAGLNWTKTDTSLAATSIYDLFVEGTNLYAASFGNGISVSNDGGNTWSVPNSGIGSINSLSVVAKGNDVFTGSSNSGVFYSSDNGINWTPVNTGLSTSANFHSVVATNTGIIANDGWMHYTVNNGSSWNTITSGLFDFSPQYMANSGDTIFTATYNENIFRSYDGGMNWTQVYNGTLFSNPFWSIAISGNRVVAGSQNGILVSSDLGATWNFANTGLTSPAVFSVAISGINMWAGTWDGVFFSNDFGANWSLYNTGFDSSQWVYSLQLDSNYVYAGTQAAGVWKRLKLDFPLTISENNLNSNHLQFYPNPFSVSATLSLDNKINFGVKNTFFEMFDAFGKKVVQFEIRNSQTEIFRGNLTSGIYFYRVISGGEIIGSGKSIIK